METKANDEQVGGDHYQSAFQHWDFVKATEMGYMMAQVARYITRDKAGLEDLQKAQHFVNKAIEQQASDKNRNSNLLDSYVETNELSPKVKSALNCAMNGNLLSLRTYMYEMVRDYVPEQEVEATEEFQAAQPTPAYVSQDPPAPPGTYSWKCRYCGERKTAPATTGGQEDLVEFSKGHAGCKAFYDTQPVA